MKFVTLAAAFLYATLAGQTSVDIQFDVNASPATFRVVGLPGAAGLSPGSLADVFSVYVDVDAGTDVPAISGTRTVSGNELIFAPRYPLQAGLSYRAVVRLPGREPIVRTFSTPKADMTPTTTVEHIYPSADAVPENHLKFYIHFSAPMSRGRAYNNIHLIGDDGRSREHPFLELAEELWDPEARRLTVFFDPGRIKRDLVPNVEVGTPIEAGKTYTLVIASGWIDAEGKTLKSEYRKTFRVTAADREALNPDAWTIRKPQASSRAALTVEFPEPMDHALLGREFEVVDSMGNGIAGSVEIDRNETRWSFVPASPWTAGPYSIRVGTVIADLAGNMIGRPFEVDVFEEVTERITHETHTLPFTIE